MCGPEKTSRVQCSYMIEEGCGACITVMLDYCRESPVNRKSAEFTCVLIWTVKSCIKCNEPSLW